MDAPLKPDMKDPVTMRYLGFQTGCGKKLRAAMNDVIKAINPEIALDKVDFLRTESHSEVDVPIWVYSASSNCRHTVGAERHKMCIRDRAQGSSPWRCTRKPSLRRRFFI